MKLLNLRKNLIYPCDHQVTPGSGLQPLSKSIFWLKRCDFSHRVGVHPVIVCRNKYPKYNVGCLSLSRNSHQNVWSDYGQRNKNLTLNLFDHPAPSWTFLPLLHLWTTACAGTELCHHSKWYQCHLISVV